MTTGKAPAPDHAAPAPASAPVNEERRERLANLWRGAVAGHRADLDGIVVELTPLLWHVARAQGLDAASCEDVVQTTWLQLLNHLDRIRTPQALTAWLVTVTRREARRLRAAGTRTRSVSVDVLESIADDSPRVDQALLDDQRQAALWRLIRKLPQRCQELLRVIAFADRPDYEAISTALEMPRGSIGPTRGRCLAKLRSLMVSSPDWSWP